MTIEFNCRVCNALIRVPDKAAGGKGKCPKCGIRITVPKKSAAKPKPKEPEVEEEVPQLFAPEPEDEYSESGTPGFEDNSEEVVELETAAFEPSDFTSPPPSPPAGDFGFAKPQPPSPVRSASRRVKKQKQKNQIMMIGAFVVLVAIVAAGFFLYPILTAERLAGDLMAGTAQRLELPPVQIDKSMVRLPPDEVTALLRKLELSPLPMSSNSMHIELSGSSAALQISIAAGVQAQFYRVSVKGNEAIQKYLQSHLTELEEQREKEIDKSLTNFFVEYQKVLGKKSGSEAVAPFRDSLAIPALVRGFGYALVAEHGRGLYRCMYEDPDGGLYFLLPGEVSTFKVVGRTDLPVTVPADFNVKVDGEIIPLKKPIDPASKKPTIKTDPKPEKDEPEMTDEKMNGKN